LGAELTGTDELDSVIEGVRDSYFGLDEEIHYQDIQKIADQDFDKAGLIIRKLTRSLATRISRRYRQSKKKQKLDIRRTIRKNIKYGGTLLELKYKTKRIHKPELLLLCDVSASMARYAGFILHFVYGLSSVVDNIESFVFSEDLDRITSAFEQDQSFATTMADIMNQSRELGRGTDLNLALTKLLKNHGQLLTKKRIIIIVSDTKTLAPDKAASQLADIQARVREIIWLNTLPKRDWKSSKAIDLFRNNCVMFECYTLAHLEKVIHNKLSF
ncbi:MAG: VWA domain-containing protein, partial [Desulfitobacterium hafniense]|nr:VWA domain-containing protein [Desulfitobacterium hafniense]